MRYKGAADSTEINKSYERAIRKIENLAIKLDSFKDKNESNSLAMNLDKSHALAYIDKLLIGIDKNTISAKDMKNISGFTINTKNNYAITNSIATTYVLSENSVECEDMYIDFFSDNEYKKRDINVSGIFSNTPWIREIETPTDVSDVYCTVVVSVPGSINPSTVANFLEFNTFPYMNCEVANVEYSPVYDNRYLTTIDEIKNHKGCTFNKYNLDKTGSGNISLAFPEKDIKKIAITLKQSTPSIDNASKKIFHIGISNLSLERRIIKSNSSIIDCTYSHNNINGVYIKDIEPVFSGIIDIKYTVSVYKKVGESLIKLYDEFEAFKTSYEDVVFRITFDTSDNLIVLKELKVIL